MALRFIDPAREASRGGTEKHSRALDVAVWNSALWIMDDPESVPEQFARRVLRIRPSRMWRLWPGVLKMSRVGSEPGGSDRGRYRPGAPSSAQAFGATKTEPQPIRNHYP